MRKTRLLSVLGTVAMAGAFALSGAPALAAGSQTSYTCTGGHIPSGSYASITVTGTCDVAAGAVIRVAGNLDVAARAALDAQSAPSTISVGHNVTAAAGSFLGLGCQPPAYTGNSGHMCIIEPGSHSTISVSGNLTAVDADTVLLNGVTVNRNVTLTGGGGATPWSIKNNTIGSNLTVSGQTADWLGVLFNRIGGNATLTNITANDPGDPTPLVYVVRNTVGRNLTCTGLVPGVSGGFIPGEVNVVGHNANGQCASLV